MSLAPVRSRLAAVTADTASGTFDNCCARPCAVTMTSWLGSGESCASAGCAAGWAAGAALATAGLASAMASTDRALSDRYREFSMILSPGRGLVPHRTAGSKLPGDCRKVKRDWSQNALYFTWLLPK